MTEDAWTGYRTFDRDEWSKLRASTPLLLEADELDALRGLNDKLDLNEVTDVYLPLSRLLNLRVAATQSLQQTTDTFLGRPLHRSPFIIGLGGSVAVKSCALREGVAHDRLYAHGASHDAVVYALLRSRALRD